MKRLNLKSFVKYLSMAVFGSDPETNNDGIGWN